VHSVERAAQHTAWYAVHSCTVAVNSSVSMLNQQQPCVDLVVYKCILTHSSQWHALLVLASAQQLLILYVCAVHYTVRRSNDYMV
jgi:Ni,Fe-hydrogenase I small subunit